MLKKVFGIWLPDGDTHFADHLEKGPEYRGAGTYQFNKIQMALNVCPKDRRGTAVDVGAHVGFWSRVLADNFQRVLAFEPVLDLAECFERNLSGVKNVRLVKSAVSAQSGSIRIQKCEGNSGNACVAVTGGFSVSATRLDDLGFTELDFLKIDVEGWELSVLQGAEQVIRKFCPVIVVEQKPDNAERYGVDRFAARDLLISWGAKQLWEKSGDYCFGW